MPIEPQLAPSHLGHAQSQDVAERIRLACESVVQCCRHLMDLPEAGVRRAAGEAMYREGVRWLDGEAAELDPAEFKLAEGTVP